ncbi:unnamed protein product, partial [Polarella glacialis]
LACASSPTSPTTNSDAGSPSPQRGANVDNNNQTNNNESSSSNNNSPQKKVSRSEDPEGGEVSDGEEVEAPFFGLALLRSALGAFGRSAGGGSERVASSSSGCADLEGRSFDIADCMEQGLARETGSDFTVPVRRSSKLWRFRVARSEDKLSARLMTDTGDFLMHAQIYLAEKRVGFYLYDPLGRDKELFNTSSPAFSMSFNSARTDWRLVQERCDNCQFSPPHLSCNSRGKQQLAHIRHLRKPVGDGVSNVMEVRIPGLYTDGSCVVWCPMLGRTDLAVVSDEANYETQQLVTKEPVWNEQVESLVLDFKGRNVLSSAKNFQLALRQKPQHCICQFGKIGPTNFGLDFRYPMNVIQAFGAAMSTIFWT